MAFFDNDLKAPLSKRRVWRWLLVLAATTTLLPIFLFHGPLKFTSRSQPALHPRRQFLRAILTTPKMPTDPHIPLKNEELEEVMQHLPSLPVDFWWKHRYDTHRFYKKRDCAPLPILFELEFHNKYWQTLRMTNGAYHFYGAYLDTRTAPSSVRILAVHEHHWPAAAYCQLWFENLNSPVLVEVQGLDFLHKDISVRLVEWIELVRLFGADKIFLYQLQVHPNTTKILRHYEERGVLEVIPITLPGHQPNLPGLQHLYLLNRVTDKRKMEMIPYNDCFYRNLYKFKWVVLLDIDEVIVPLKDPDWPSLMRRLDSNELYGQHPEVSWYFIQNLFFPDELQRPEIEKSIPPYMRMLQHVQRAKNFSQFHSQIKSISSTRTVKVLHNHNPLGCINGPCEYQQVNESIARVQHYRAGCMWRHDDRCQEKDKKESMRDTALWRWRDKLVPKVKRVLRATGFLRFVPFTSSANPLYVE